MEKSISSDLIRGHIDTIILHSLLDGDKFAQQISESIENKSNNEYQINQATLYSSLKRLENLKYVSAYWNDSSSGRRRYFKLTELGKSVVEQNLSNWSYSKGIIDKLMDLESEPVIKTQVVEKIVEKIVTVPQSEVQPTSPVISANETTATKPNQNKDDFEAEQEVNFRNILNGLIKSSKNNNDLIKEEDVAENLDTVIVQPDEPEKVSLNDTIITSNYNKLKPANSNGNIDYGEMALQAEKEGYKLLFSSKESRKIKGSVYINKINLWASLLTYLLVMLEYLVVVLTSKNILNLSIGAVIGSILVLTVFPTVFAIVFFKNPKMTGKILKKDTILTVLIVVFNLLLITFAIDLLIGLNFSDTYLLILSFIVPCIIYFDILVFYSTRYYLSKRRYFINK